MARNKKGSLAMCMVDECRHIIKTPNCGTSGCRHHLINAHGVDLSTNKPELLETDGPSPPKISKYFPKKETYPGYLVRLCTLANIPFHQLASEEFQEIFVAKGFGEEVVKSPNTIRRHILAFASEIRAEISKEICDSKSESDSAISITIDEWTSTAVKRYLGVNVHLQDKCWHLGLYRLKGSSPAAKILDLLSIIMTEHGLDCKMDVFGVTSDAASVMKLLGII